MRPTGRVVPLTLPAVELAVIVHLGSHADIDRSYGTLARFVAERAIGIEGKIRERYLVDRRDRRRVALAHRNRVARIPNERLEREDATAISARSQ